MIRSLLFAAAASLAFAACATDPGAGPAAGERMSTERHPYVQPAGASDRYEIQSSELALTRAQNPAVRAFAQQLIDHHRQSLEQLYAAARAAGMIRTHDWMLPPPMQAMVEELQRASGADFDRLYLRQQVQAHEAALALHRDYARDGDVPALRAAAATAVPIVEQHLARARQLD